jgi:hypothetical protein
MKEDRMLNTLSIKCLSFLLLVMFFLPGISFGFHEQVRCQAFKDAISLCPNDLKSYLTANFDAAHEGIHFADRNRQWRSSFRPQDGEVFYGRIVTDLREGKGDYNTAHRFGVLACVIAETISPGDYYSLEKLIPEKVVYNGFQEAGNVNANLSGLVVKYRKPYQHNMSKEVNDFLYNVAVNEIVNYWTSAWQAGGKETGLLTRRGTSIAHKDEVLHFGAVG